jgi:hypothetical protein
MYQSHPGHVVVIQNSIYSTYPLYSAMGLAKIEQYPPPDDGSYGTPWCWVDGHNDGYTPADWSATVDQEVSETSRIGISLSGTYHPGTRTGTVQAVFLNDSSASVAASAYFVVTLDSVMYKGGNGQMLHSHVARNYIPSQTGASITIPAGGADTLSEDFAVQDTWSTEKCNIVVFLQDSTVQPDSSKITLQAAIAPVLKWANGVAEQEPAPARKPSLAVGPNPCPGLLCIQLDASGPAARIDISDATGRLVRSLSLSGQARSMVDLRAAAEGVYFVVLHGRPETAQKLVVQH